MMVDRVAVFLTQIFLTCEFSLQACGHFCDE